MATELEKIISVSGKPGLFKVISAGKSAVVAESLLDGKRTPILSTQKVSTLADISMFTYEEDVPLRDVLKKMVEVYPNEGPDNKLSGQALREEFKKTLPDFDQDRVYESDIRKLFTWFNLLKKNGLVEFEEEADSEGSEKE
jgi:Domain of unknown function (DUF5606)